MKKEIETHLIFLDSSIFIKENFFAGNKLKAFLNYKQESKIELITTEITKNECISNLGEFLATSNTIFNKALKEINNKAKAFKNIDSLSPIFNLQNSFNFDEEKKVLEEKFTKLISDYFKEINIDSKKTIKVVDDYFKQNAPFKDGKKKHEFPDAIVLNSLDSWCQKKKKKIYVVADDDDMNSYESEFLIPIKEYDKLLDQISFTFSDENITQKIEDIIEDNRIDIISIIEQNFIGNFPSDGFDNSQGFEYEINSIERTESYIEEYSVLQIFDNIATVELSVPMEYDLDVSYDDTNTGWYDKEDDRWYGVEHVNREISGNCTLTVIVEIEFELPGKEAIWKKWEFKEITDGIPSDISIDDY